MTPAPTVSGLLAAYRAWETTPSEVVGSLLARIAEQDEVLGSFSALLAEEATEGARAATRAMEEGRWLGPLHGIPVGVKELIDVAGAPVSYGSDLFAHRLAGRDAPVVERIRRAGGVVLGMTRSHELGWGITTQHVRRAGTRNPWDLERVPGGSSGGSAAAVSAGFLPLALGTDTGGSVRIPAAACGVAGMKPTYGRVPKLGVVPLAPSLDHVGPLARTVADLSLVLPVLSGYLAGDPSTSDLPPPELPPASPIRLAVCPDLHLVPLAPDHLRLFEGVVAALGGAGWRVEETSLPDAGEILPTFGTIQRAEALHVHQHVLGTFPGRADEYGPDVRGRLEGAREVGLSDYLEATATRQQVRRRFEELFRGDVDVLVTPVSAGPPSTVSSPDLVTHLGREMPFRDLVLGYTVPQDLTGLPSVVVPIGLDDQGLPVGLQLTAAWGREADALAAARLVEGLVDPLPPPPR